MDISSEKIPKLARIFKFRFDYKVLPALRTKGIFRCCLLTDLDVKKFQFFFTPNAPKSIDKSVVSVFTFFVILTKEESHLKIKSDFFS